MLVGLAAPAGSRKTIAAKHLMKAYGMTYYHAGTPVKKAARAMGLSREAVQKDSVRDAPNHPVLGGREPRDLMEGLGEATHIVAPKLTTLAMAKAVGPHLAAGRDVVVDGVRSEHEANWIKKNGGTLIGIDRTAPDPKKPLDMRQANIVKDHMVDGSGSKAELRANLDKAMAKCMA